MITTMVRKRRRFNAPNNSSSSKVFLPFELITEILSRLSVKDIVRFKCVSKSLNTLTSDSYFVDKHLKVSSQNPHLTLYWYQQNHKCFDVVPFPVYRLLKNPCINLYYSNTFHLLEDRLENCYQLVGSCNGLLCLRYNPEKCTQTVKLCFWNPATRTTSEKLGSLRIASRLGNFHFTFGYDSSTRTYKVVVCRAKEIEGSWKSEVKVFTLGDDCWRNIQSFPVVPFNWLDIPNRRLNEGVHFSGTVNWLARVEQFVIVSLCLSTESYKEFMLPPGFDEVPFLKPVLRVLMDCLCFSYDSNKTEFVLWQMKQYGVHESWTQLFKIRYQNFPMHKINSGFLSACLYVNGDMVIFANRLYKNYHNHAFIYNLKDKTVERINFKNCIQWFYYAKDYVESLVSVC